MSPLSADQQRIGLVAAGVVVGLGLLVFGMTRLIPVATAIHTNAVVEQQAHCSTEDDSGTSCDMIVSFDVGSRRIRATIAGANPGEVSTSSSGQRVLEIYYQSDDPYHPHELADDEINDALLILAGLAATVIALVAWFRRRVKQEPSGEASLVRPPLGPFPRRTRP